MDNNVFKTFMDKMNLEAAITDKENRLVYINDAFKSETGYGEEALGQKPSVLKSGFHSLMYYNNLKMTVDSGMRWEGRFKNRRKDGSTYFEEAAIFPMEVNGTTYYGKVAFNTTKHEKLASETEQSIKMAKVIQRALLSDDIYENDIMIRADYRPLENVSGDIYNVFRVNDHTYCILLADVAGHGVGSALLSTSIIAVANELVNVNYMPDIFLKNLNERVMSLLNTKEMSLITYFTAAYVVVDTMEQKIYYANCGHPKFYFLREEEVEEISCVNFSIGMFKGVDFEYGTSDYKAGDSLLIYTDGLIELEQGIQVGRQNLEEALKVYRKEHKCSGLVDYLKKNIVEPQIDNMNDDVTYIGIDFVNAKA